VIAEAVRRSPLAGHAERFAALSGGNRGRAIDPRVSFVAQMNLRADPRDAGVMQRLASSLGFALPMVPNMVAYAKDRRALWLGPDEWLVVGPDVSRQPSSRNYELVSMAPSARSSTSRPIEPYSRFAREGARPPNSWSGDRSRRALARQRAVRPDPAGESRCNHGASRPVSLPPISADVVCDLHCGLPTGSGGGRQQRRLNSASAVSAGTHFWAN